MAEYTPSTDQVREGFATDPIADYHDPLTNHAAEGRRAFDRWLAQHDAEALAGVRAAVANLLALPAINTTEAVNGVISALAAIDKIMLGLA